MHVVNKTTNIIIALLIVLMVGSWISDQNTSKVDSGELKYSEFINSIKTGGINEVVVDESNRLITGVDSTGKDVKAIMPYDGELINTLIARDISFKVKEPEKPSILMAILLNFLPILLVVALWIYLMRQMQGGGGKGAMSFGKSKAKLLNQDNNRVTFDDVAGVEESKEEVQEIVDFLRDPSKFQKLGGRMPSGVLMTGSPGTGLSLIHI